MRRSHFAYFLPFRQKRSDWRSLGTSAQGVTYKWMENHGCNRWALPMKTLPWWWSKRSQNLQCYSKDDRNLWSPCAASALLHSQSKSRSTSNFVQYIHPSRSLTGFWHPPLLLLFALIQCPSLILSMSSPQTEAFCLSSSSYGRNFSYLEKFSLSSACHAEDWPQYPGFLCTMLHKEKSFVCKFSPVWFHLSSSIHSQSHAVHMSRHLMWFFIQVILLTWWLLCLLWVSNNFGLWSLEFQLCSPTFN